MADESDAFYVVRKGDMVGIYKQLSDCQAQVGSSVCDPSVSVCKGYSLPKEAVDYVASKGLKDALYSIHATHLKVDMFGTLVPCPFPTSLDKSSSSSNVLRSSSPNHNQRHLSLGLVGCQQMKTSLKSSIGARSEGGSGSEREGAPFDIFRISNSPWVKLKKPLYLVVKERSEAQRAKDAPKYLRSGMVLLKNFLDPINQVKILNKCRDLGIGPGGFYRPGYNDGAKLRLQMMCLGMDWDPDSRLYNRSRSFDGAVAPEIPDELRNLVDVALHEAVSFLSRSAKSEDEIPKMKPDTCIVNFYSNGGKLGLHQDRDESAESLEEGLPVVSFSIGDSAEFLYSDGRDAYKADKVMLESGDVLIFGGKSRHIFHGVPSIKPNTAPKFLFAESRFSSGHLNLTFRKY